MFSMEEDFSVNSKYLMDLQTNNVKPSDIIAGIEEVFQDPFKSSIRSDCVSKVKAIWTQNVYNVIIDIKMLLMLSIQTPSPKNLIIWRFLWQVCLLS